MYLMWIEFLHPVNERIQNASCCFPRDVGGGRPIHLGRNQFQEVLNNNRLVLFSRIIHKQPLERWEIDNECKWTFRRGRNTKTRELSFLLAHRHLLHFSDKEITLICRNSGKEIISLYMVMFARSTRTPLWCPSQLRPSRMQPSECCGPNSIAMRVQMTFRTQVVIQAKKKNFRNSAIPPCRRKSPGSLRPQACNS